MTLIALIAVINENKEVLLLKRKGDVHCPNVWSFPGGKNEPGERIKETAKRELKEETQIVVNDLTLIGEHRHHYHDRFLQFTLFTTLLTNQTIVVAESDIMWYSISKLHDLQMPEANQILIGILESYLRTKEKSPPA